MQPASGQPAASSNLVDVKLRSEILKLKSERSLLRRQMKRGDRPTWWEVVKTVVPWVSLAVGALAFATGYVQSLRQERQRLLQTAMGHYLGDHPEIGVSLLRELMTGGEGMGLLTPQAPDVPVYLVQGMDVEPKDARTDALNHRRNIAALQALTELEPPVELLCAKCSAAGPVLDLQRNRDRTKGDEERKQQDETRRSAEFLCQCGTLLDKLDPREEKCQRETWKEAGEPVPGYLGRKDDCVLRASPVPGRSSPGPASADRGEG